MYKLSHFMMRQIFSRILLLLLLSATTLAARADIGVGDALPAFDTPLLDGRVLEGKALAGKPLLVMFWATWCPICRRELPKVQGLYERYRDAGFEVLALSIDVEQVEVELFQQEHRHTFPVAMRAPAHTTAFDNVRLPPRFYLVGRDGKLAWKHVGAIRDDRLEAALKALL